MQLRRLWLVAVAIATVLTSSPCAAVPPCGSTSTTIISTTSGTPAMQRRFTNMFSTADEGLLHGVARRIGEYAGFGSEAGPGGKVARSPVPFTKYSVFEHSETNLMDKRQAACNTVADCPGMACHAAVCDLATCTCKYASLPDGTFCSDGLFCTDGDSCQTGFCVGGNDNPCRFGDVCNSVCNEVTDTCFSPGGTACSDGLFCNGADQCNGAGSCYVHSGDPCSSNPKECEQTCDEMSDTCSAPTGTPCTSDSIFCNGEERCDGTGNCSSSGDPCSGSGCLACHEPSNNCKQPNGTVCGPSTACTDQQCTAGICETVIASGRACNDQNNWCVLRFLWNCCSMFCGR
jgi:hypothetical protein